MFRLLQEQSRLDLVDMDELVCSVHWVLTGGPKAKSGPPEISHQPQVIGRKNITSFIYLLNQSPEKYHVPSPAFNQK